MAPIPHQVIDQISSDLAKDVGVVAWLLMVVTVSGVGTIGFFLRRITQAMDRMAAAHESLPAIVAELRTLLIERLDRIEPKIDQAVGMASEHTRIARLWERTEAPGRQVRRED